jgi:hypothetical protein
MSKRKLTFLISNDVYILQCPDDVVKEILKINVTNIKSFGLTCQHYYKLFNDLFWLHQFKVDQLTLLGDYPFSIKEWVNKYNDLFYIKQRTNKMLKYMEDNQNNKELIIMTFKKHDSVELLLGEQIIKIKKLYDTNNVFFQTIVIYLNKKKLKYYLAGVQGKNVIKNVCYEDFFYKLFYYYRFITMQNCNHDAIEI